MCHLIQNDTNLFILLLFGFCSYFFFAFPSAGNRNPYTTHNLIFIQIKSIHVYDKKIIIIRKAKQSHKGVVFSQYLRYIEHHTINVFNVRFNFMSAFHLNLGLNWIVFGFFCAPFKKCQILCVCWCRFCRKIYFNLQGHTMLYRYFVVDLNGMQRKQVFCILVFWDIYMFCLLCMQIWGIIIAIENYF